MLTFSDPVLIYWLLQGTTYFGSFDYLYGFQLSAPKFSIPFFVEIRKEVATMASSSNASKCCSMEKKKLMAELEKCNFCSDDYEAFHDCYREAARQSGQRSRACLVS